MPEAATSDGKPRPNDEVTDSSQTVAVGQLRALIERVERLEEEKKTIGDDIKSVTDEAAGRGYDKKVLKEMLKLRAMDKAKRENWEALRQSYAEALGVFE